MAKSERLVYPIYRPDCVLRMRLLELFTLCLLTAVVVIYVKILRTRQFCHANLLFHLISQPIAHMFALWSKEIGEPYGLTVRFRTFCHGNLLFLLISQPIAHMFALWSRVAKHIVDYSGLMTPNLLFVFNYFSDIFISTCFQIVLGYSIERMVAVKYVHTYDKMWNKRPLLGYMLVCGAVVYSIILLFPWEMYWISSAIAYSAQYLLFTMATMFFIILKIYSLGQYKVVAVKKYSTIDERYQTTRNLRAAQLLLHLAPYKCLTNFVSLALYYWVFEMHEPFYMPYYSTFYFVLNHLQLFVQMCLTIYSHSTLRLSFREFFGLPLNKQPEEVRNALGKKMIFNISESNEVYFRQMQSVWDIAEENHRKAAKYKRKQTI